jgi:hypothetical protein
MQTRRGTVLGKRGYHESSSAKTQVVCEQLHTPESSPNPKRPRTSLTLDDDGSNKENIPPLKDCLISAELTPPRRARALRRSATEDTTPMRLGHIHLFLAHLIIHYVFRYPTLCIYVVSATVYSINNNNFVSELCNATTNSTRPLIASSYPYPCSTSLHL